MSVNMECVANAWIRRKGIVSIALQMLQERRATFVARLMIVLPRFVFVRNALRLLYLQEMFCALIAGASED